jgi:acetyltransferase-like isoleucine patch superfamily enzyme
MAERSLLVRRLLERGLRFKDIYSLYRIVRLKLRYGTRLRLASLSLGLERGSTLLIEKQSSVHFGHLVYVRKGTDIEAHDSAMIQIGDRVFFNKDCMIVARSEIRIGSDCLFGEQVSIYDHNHRYAKQGMAFREQGFDCKTVVIGSNVWVGAKAFISAGVTIGDNVVVGAGAIITKDVPSNTMAFTRATAELRPLHAWQESIIQVDKQ